MDALKNDDSLKPYNPWDHTSLPSEDVAEEDLLIGTKWQTGLRFTKTDPNNGESKEMVFEFEMEFTDHKVSDEDVRRIQASKMTKNLSLKDCRQLQVKSSMIPITSASYSYSSAVGEQLKEQAESDASPGFLPLIIVLELAEDGLQIEDTVFPGPLILLTTQHSMATWKERDEGVEESELTSKLNSVMDDFNTVNKKIEESKNGFAQWGMRFQQAAMIPGMIQKGFKTLGEFSMTLAAMPTKEELELSSRRDVALRKQVNLKIGDKEGSVEIKAITTD